MSKKNNVTRTIVIGDQHIPYLDTYAEELVRKVASEIGVTNLIVAGDLVDWMQMSHFAKNPFVRLNSTQEDADMAHNYLAGWRKIIGPKGKLIYISGNHEHRFETWRKLHPEMAHIKGLDISSVMDLKGAGVDQFISYCPSEWNSATETPAIYWINDFAVIHGVRYSIIAGNVCNMYLRDYGCSGLSFHNHKNARASRRYLRKNVEWYESGCLCQLNPEYKTNPNWQQGFAIITQYPDGGALDVEVVSIYNNKAAPGQRYCHVHGKKITRISRG